MSSGTPCSYIILCQRITSKYFLHNYKCIKKQTEEVRVLNFFKSKADTDCNSKLMTSACIQPTTSKQKVKQSNHYTRF